MNKSLSPLAYISLALFCISSASGESGSTNYPLIIDPILSWNTFLGGTGGDRARSLVVDPNGNIYVAGESGSRWGTPIRAHSDSGLDVFVAKLSPNGILQWNTFLGGPGGANSAIAIGLDAWGNIYVSGESSWTWGSPLRQFSLARDQFVAKLSPSGELIWNTFLGGAGDEKDGSLAVSPNGDCFVAGSASASWGSPVRPFSPKEHAWDLYPDMSIAKVNSDGLLEWNTFLGGSSSDFAFGIALDNDGGVYIAGKSNSTWGDPIVPFPGGYDKAVVAKLSSGGSLTWNTFFQQFYGQHLCSDIAVSPRNQLVIVGLSTNSWGTPIRPYEGGFSDGFAAALDLDGQFLWNTFLGGPGGPYIQESCTSVAISGAGSIYVSGGSDSSWGSPDIPFGEQYNGFVARLNAAGALQALAFVGGRENWCYDLGVDEDRGVYVAGSAAASFGSPVRPYVWQEDGFVSKLVFVPDAFNRVAVGDFDGDGTGEPVMSFPGLGVWSYGAGAWIQVSPDDAEELVAANVNGNFGLDRIPELVGDFGAKGLWLRQDGSWTQLSPWDAEYITVREFDWDYCDDLFCDFGGLGLWRWDHRVWTQLSASDPDYMAIHRGIALYHQSFHVLYVDFGPAGIQYITSNLPSGISSWRPFSSLDPDFFLCDLTYDDDIVVDFGASGLWLSDLDSWLQLSGLSPEYMIPGINIYGSNTEILADFGPVGLWYWDGAGWIQLSAADAEYMISVQADADNNREAYIDFGSLGLWEYNDGVWVQLSAADPENLVTTYFGLLADFGPLGVWVQYGGVWTQISPDNPD